MSAITHLPTSHAIALHSDREKITHQDPLQAKTSSTALKALAIAGIVTGSTLAIGGAVTGVALCGTAYLESDIGFQLFIGATELCWPIGGYFVEFSLFLLSNPITALGTFLTLPVAGFFYILPFLPAFVGVIGSLPGLGIAVGSYFLFKRQPA